MSELDTRAKQVAATSAGVKALGRALPRVIDVQERLFGAAGRPGGRLHRALLRIVSDGKS